MREELLSGEMCFMRGLLDTSCQIAKEVIFSENYTLKNYRSYRMLGGGGVARGRMFSRMVSDMIPETFTKR
jgi:hypothetical protein